MIHVGVEQVRPRPTRVNTRTRDAKTYPLGCFLTLLPTGTTKNHIFIDKLNTLQKIKEDILFKILSNWQHFWQHANNKN